MRISTLISSAILLVGAALLIGAGGTLWSSLDRVHNHVDTEGVVIGMHEELDTQDDDGGDGYYYYPEIEFEDAFGVTHRFRSRLGTGAPAYEVGDSVPVLYDLADPRDAVLHGFWSLYLAPIVLGILGLAFAAWGIAMFALVDSRTAPAGVIRMSAIARGVRSWLGHPPVLVALAIGFAGGLWALWTLRTLGMLGWVLVAVFLVFGCGIGTLLASRRGVIGRLSVPAFLFVIGLGQCAPLVYRASVGDPDLNEAYAFLEGFAARRDEREFSSAESRKVHEFSSEALPALIAQSQVTSGLVGGRPTIRFVQDLGVLEITHTLDVRSGEWTVEE